MTMPKPENTSFNDDQLASMSKEDIQRATRLLDNEIRILKEESQRVTLEILELLMKLKKEIEKKKIKPNKQEILETNPEDI